MPSLYLFFIDMVLRLYMSIVHMGQIHKAVVLSLCDSKTQFALVHLIMQTCLQDHVGLRSMPFLQESPLLDTNVQCSS